MGQKPPRPEQLVLTQADQVPPPEPTVPEPLARTRDKLTAARRVVEEMGPEAPAPAIRDRLAERGVEVDLPLIAHLKNQVARERGGACPAPSGEEADYDALLQVKHFADRMGGLERLHELVEVLLRLKD